MKRPLSVVQEARDAGKQLCCILGAFDELRVRLIWALINGQGCRIFLEKGHARRRSS
jgi:hypothetical protein